MHKPHDFNYTFQVICTAHSKLSIDGQPRGGGKEYLAIIAKDGEKKGFFIRIVDKEVSLSMHYLLSSVFSD